MTRATAEVVVDLVEDRIEVQLHTAATVGAAIGERVLAEFYKCFAGVERIQTYQHLIYLNRQAELRHAGDPTSQPEADTHAFSRNARTLGMLIIGILYEFGSALQSLCNAKVIDRLSDRSAWAPLNELRGEWHQDELAGLFRHNFAHHLGETKDYLAGLQKAKTSGVVVVNRMTGGRLFMGEYPAPIETLMQAHGVEEDSFKKYREILERSMQTTEVLPHLVTDLFYAVLDSNGVAIRTTPGAIRATKQMKADVAKARRDSGLPS